MTNCTEMAVVFGAKLIRRLFAVNAQIASGALTLRLQKSGRTLTLTVTAPEEDGGNYTINTQLD